MAKPVFTSRPTVADGYPDGIVVVVNGHDLFGIYPAGDQEGDGWDVGYWDADTGEWVESVDSADVADQLAKYVALPPETAP